jgi:hypothetical protein
LTFGVGIIILQVVSRRKSLAGVNIMHEKFNFHLLKIKCKSVADVLKIFTVNKMQITS